MLINHLHASVYDLRPQDKALFLDKFTIQNALFI